jgi:hypothetical protein
MTARLGRVGVLRVVLVVRPAEVAFALLQAEQRQLR